MRSTALVKSVRCTLSAPRRVASSAASFTRLARSAPVKPGVNSAICTGSTSGRQHRLFQMHFQDRDAILLIGAIDEDLAVEAAGAQQRGVEHLRPVGGRQQDHAGRGIEAVEFHQQLVERLLLLVVAAERIGAAGAAERVEFVDEDDRRRLLSRLLEQVAHARGADADEHLDELRAGNEKNLTPASPAHRARVDRARFRPRLGGGDGFGADNRSDSVAAGGVDSACHVKFAQPT